MSVAPKRTKTQRAADRQQITRLRLLGRTNAEIATAIGVSERTIQRELRLAEADWNEAAAQDMARVKARELAKLDLLEREAIDAWLKSKEPYSKRVVEDRPPAVGKGAPGRYARIETGQGHGDPRLLATVLSIMERRARLLGSDAPAKHALTDPTGTEDRAPVAFPLPPELTLDQWTAACQAALRPKLN